MRCASARRAIRKSLLGDLPRDAEAFLERHLAGCALCRVVLVQEEALDRALDSWRAPSLPGGFGDRVADAAVAERRADRSGFARLRALSRVRIAVPLPAAAAVLLALFVGGTFVLRSLLSGPPEEGATERIALAARHPEVDSVPVGTGASGLVWTAGLAAEGGR